MSLPQKLIQDLRRYVDAQVYVINHAIKKGNIIHLDPCLHSFEDYSIIICMCFQSRFQYSIKSGSDNLSQHGIICFIRNVLGVEHFGCK